VPVGALRPVASTREVSADPSVVDQDIEPRLGLRDGPRERPDIRQRPEVAEVAPQVVPGRLADRRQRAGDALGIAPV
jgi:hypothetical protein